MAETAKAVGDATAGCAAGGDIFNPGSECNRLGPTLERVISDGPLVTSEGPTVPNIVNPGWAVSLRGPAIPGLPGARGPQGDVVVTEKLADGECAVVFKEFRGLTIRLRFEFINEINYPFVETFGFVLDKNVPTWVLEWVPAQYITQWSMCNSGGQIVRTVSDEVHHDTSLQFFWKYFGNE